MSDPKLEHAILEPTYRTLVESVKNKDIKKVTESFCSNIDRTNLLIVMPIMCACYSSIVFTTTQYELLINKDKLPESLEERMEFIASKAKLRSDRMLRHRGVDPGVAWHMSEEEIRTWARFLTDLTSIAGGTAELAFESIFASMIVGVWTAFETLAADLWETGVNHGPKKWAKNVTASQEKTSLKPDGLGGQRDQEKMIAISDLGDYGYDLRRKMGSLLRRSEKVDFQSFNNLFKAYESTFNRSDISSIFDDPLNKDVRALEAVRNLVVHRASKVDVRFRAKTKGFSRYSSLQLGDTLVIDGEMVQDLTKPAIHLGSDLILYVDAKLNEENPIPDHDWCI